MKSEQQGSEAETDQAKETKPETNLKPNPELKPG